MKKLKIAPSLLSADFLNLASEIESLEEAAADILHLDVMDNHFVPNITFGFPIISQIRKKTFLPLDVHLMVNNPEEYILPLSKIGVEYISFHMEINTHHHRLIRQIKDLGIKAGIVLNPATNPILAKYILAEVDFVLLMSVNPGFGGQSFLPLVYEKIEYLAEYRKEKNLNFEIEIDGGVSEQNAKILFEKGADILVAGNYVFQKNKYKEQIENLKK